MVASQLLQFFGIHVHVSIQDYLETKRQLFPRFYFISDNELLDIMSHTRNPFAVQVYVYVYCMYSGLMYRYYLYASHT